MGSIHPIVLCCGHTVLLPTLFRIEDFSEQSKIHWQHCQVRSLGLWLISVGTLIVLGIRQAAEFSYTGSVNDRSELVMEVPSDTLMIKMKDIDIDYSRDDIHFGRMTFGYDENDKRVLMSDEIDIKIRKSDDDTMSVTVRKDADGSSTPAARDRAKNIEYGYSVDGNVIVLDKHLITDISNKARNQEVTVTIYIPEGKTVYFDDSTSRYIGRGINNASRVLQEWYGRTILVNG